MRCWAERCVIMDIPVTGENPCSGCAAPHLGGGFLLEERLTFDALDEAYVTRT
jgi:hypothetical protein